MSCSRVLSRKGHEVARSEEVACGLGFPPSIMHLAGLKYVLVAFVEGFADAWNRHDVEALITFMADNCVFGDDGRPRGFAVRGADRVWEAFSPVFAMFHDLHFGVGRH